VSLHYTLHYFAPLYPGTSVKYCGSLSMSVCSAEHFSESEGVADKLTCWMQSMLVVEWWHCLYSQQRLTVWRHFTRFCRRVLRWSRSCMTLSTPTLSQMFCLAQSPVAPTSLAPLLETMFHSRSSAVKSSLSISDALLKAGVKRVWYVFVYMVARVLQFIDYMYFSSVYFSCMYVCNVGTIFLSVAGAWRI